MDKTNNKSLSIWVDVKRPDILNLFKSLIGSDIVISTMPKRIDYANYQDYLYHIAYALEHDYDGWVLYYSQKSEPNNWIRLNVYAIRDGISDAFRQIPELVLPILRGGTVCAMDAERIFDYIIPLLKS